MILFVKSIKSFAIQCQHIISPVYQVYYYTNEQYGGAMYNIKCNQESAASLQCNINPCFNIAVSTVNNRKLISKSKKSKYSIRLDMSRSTAEKEQKKILD